MLGVSCRGWRRDDRGVHDRALAQQQFVLFQVLHHLGEGLRGELAGLQQTLEVEDAGLVLHRPIIQLNTDEPAHGLHVIERFLHARIGQPVPRLQGRTPAASSPEAVAGTVIARLGVAGLDQCL